MEGYVIERMEQRTVNGNAVEITTYQGDHRDEYLVREVKSGQCSLFYKGILQFSWMETNGVRTGELTVYDQGKEVSRGIWNGVDGKENRYMEKSKNGKELVVEGNEVIYRGGFDNVKSMKREGKGMEYDRKRRKVLRYGVWKHDGLFQVIQEFESDRVMIEYDTEEGEENANMLNRHPVYEGGYMFDEATSSYLRHGEGCEIKGGIAVREGKWERGKLVESTDLLASSKSEALSRLMRILRNEMYCESVLKKNDEKHSYLALCKCDGFRWLHEGIIEKPTSIVLQMNLDRVVEVNVELHELLSVNGEDVSGIEKNQVLNLSDEGERWEGDVFHDEPYGWGVVYDKEGEKTYEGFRIGDVSVCYGIQYYADIGVVEYKGEICDGKRWGRGIQYDRNGVVVYDGEWMNNEHDEKRIVMNDETQFLHSCIEELIVSDRSCNGEEWSAFDLSFMSHLRLFEVGDECFENVTEVKLIGLHALERVVIGHNSVTQDDDDDDDDPNGHFYLKDCEQLKELKVGCESFADFTVCEITNVPSLEVIEMGELNEDSYNFFYASLELKSDDDEMN